MARTRCQTIVRPVRKGLVEAYIKVPGAQQHSYFGLFKTTKAAREAARAYCQSRGYSGVRGCGCGG